MMKKILLLLLTIFTFSIAFAQINSDAPWMKDLNVESRTTPLKFQEIVDAANAYWETLDKDAKGSGYKPFKRWENHWKNYVNEDGYLPTSTQLWDTWLTKKAQIEAHKSQRSVQTDISN